MSKIHSLLLMLLSPKQTPLKFSDVCRDAGTALEHGAVKKLRVIEACEKQKSFYHLSMMEFRDLVSLSRTILLVSVSKVSRLVSVSLNIAKKWYRKFSLYNSTIFVCCICR